MAVITGTDDGEFLTGSLDHQGDSISGLGGNDRIDAGRRTKPNTGTDFVDGGAGIDTLLFSSNGLGGDISLNMVDASIFVRSSDGTFFVDAINMEKVEFFGGLGDDTVSTIDNAAQLDGGFGIDTWTADYSKYSSNMFYTVASGINEILPGVRSIENFDRINLTTGSGNDRVSTRGFGDTIITGAGNDSIDAGWRVTGETDAVDAGIGIDTLAVFARTETDGVNVFQTGGTGFAVRSVSEKYFVDAAGVEVLHFTGGHGNDTINTGNSAEAKIVGNEGVDHWLADLSALTTSVNIRLPNARFGGGRFEIVSIERLTMTTGSGNDTIRAGNQIDEIRTGAGNDVIDAGSCPVGGMDTVDGGVGIDTFVVDATGERKAIQLGASGPGAFSFFLRSDSGRFQVDAHNMERVDFTGGDGNDVINIGVHGGTVQGGRGINHLIVDRGASTSRIAFDIDGGFGTHNIPDLGKIASIQRLTLFTGDGNDSVRGGNHGDDIRTGEGNDTIDAAGVSTRNPTGTDFVDGGLGTDLLVVDATFEGFPVQVFFTGSGFDVRSKSERFFIDADNVERLNFEGTNSNAGDRASGGSGKDTLDGADGKDTLIGGGDKDVLRGGEGRDIFDYNAASESLVRTSDRIVDFATGVDRFDLRDMGAGFTFIGRREFSGTGSELRSRQGFLEGDVDGDGRADFHVDLANNASVVRDDLLL